MHVTLNLNAKLMPIDRGEWFEDVLDEALQKEGYGFVDGGGTALCDSKEISSCDVEIYIEDDKEVNMVLDFIENYLEEKVGIPKGSKFLGENLEKEIGHLEGLGIYLAEKNEDIDMSVLQELFSNTFDEMEKEVLYSSNCVNDVTVALYFYGLSFEKMKEIAAEVIKGYPQFTCELRQIA